MTALVRFGMMVDPTFLAAIDAFGKKRQGRALNRTEAVRTLVKAGLLAAGMKADIGKVHMRGKQARKIAP